MRNSEIWNSNAFTVHKDATNRAWATSGKKIMYQFLSFFYNFTCFSWKSYILFFDFNFFYRMQKIRLDKTKLLDLLGVKKSQFVKLSEEMQKICSERISKNHECNSYSFHLEIFHSSNEPHRQWQSYLTWIYIWLGNISWINFSISWLRCGHTMFFFMQHCMWCCKTWVAHGLLFTHFLNQQNRNKHWFAQ